MAHLAFVALPYQGHLNPMRALARELMRRGHRATFLGIPDMGPLLAGAEMGFRPVGTATHPKGTLAGLNRRLSNVEGLIGVPGIVRDVTAQTDMLARDLPPAVRAIGADLIVGDGVESACGLVADHLQLPLVTVANALPLNREWGMPPAFTGWRYGTSPWAIKRNRSGWRVIDIVMRRQREMVAEHSARLRIPIRHGIDGCLSRLAQISQLVEGLDFPRARAPVVFHYCGPLRDTEADDAAFMAPPADGRPLAYGSLGSMQGGRIGLMRRIAEAGRRLDLQLVLSHGGALSAEQVATLPGRPATYAWVPQDQVLRGAKIAILNGGLNTVLDALTRGVPVVTVPIAFEQAAIAARLERSGAGRTVRRHFLTAGRLARAIRSVLDDPSYATAAERLGVEIRQAGGVRRAADIVEAVLASGRPVLREGAEPQLAKT